MSDSEKPALRFIRKCWRAVSGVLEIFSVLFCVATATGFFGRAWWGLELTSHFPLQFGAGLLVLAILWTASRNWWLAGLCGAFALINIVKVTLVIWPTAAVVVDGDTHIRIASLNVHTENKRGDLVLDFLRDANADVVLLMEVDERWIRELQPLRTNYPFSLIEPREDNFGIALFSRIPLTSDRVIQFGAGVPSIASGVKVGDAVIHLVGTHPLPPSSAENSRLRNHQLNEIARYVSRQRDAVVVIGDLNVTPWSPFFRDLLRESGLKNSSQGRGLFGSWPAWLPFGRIPIDHCLVSPTIHVVSKRLGPNVGSDHLPLIVEIGGASP